MPRPTRAELEVENDELFSRLERIRDEVFDLFDNGEDTTEADDGSDGDE